MIDAVRPEAGKVVAGRYRLERPLASGGMGALWIARHLQLDVPVAVKFILDEVRATASGSARFLREAKSAARLRSPHVVRTYDYDLVDGTPYIAMELLEGESLQERLERVGRLSAADTAIVVRQVAKALREAHELGIVHRDLKPSNIFFASMGDDEIVKLLDFGIAKDTKDLLDDSTASGTVIGSPYHMSPEQARGGEVDARSDLWSLGVVVFQCLTGTKPFPGTNMGDVIARICADTIPRPSASLPELGPEVDRFVERALARNPALRFASAREMADTFDEVAAGRGARAVGAVVPLEASRSDVMPRSEATAVDLARAGATMAVETTTSAKRSTSRWLVPSLLALAVGATGAYVLTPHPGGGLSSPPIPAATGEPSALPEREPMTSTSSAAPVVAPETPPETPSPLAPSSVTRRAPLVPQHGANRRPPPQPRPSATSGPAPASRSSGPPDDKFF